jgi:hypothetical protein
MRIAAAWKAVGATVLGVLSITLMVFSETEENTPLARWSILAALGCCTLVLLVAMDVVVRHALSEDRRNTAELLARERAHTDEMLEIERQHTEELIERLAAHFAERARGLRPVVHDRH